MRPGRVVVAPRIYAGYPYYYYPYGYSSFYGPGFYDSFWWGSAGWGGWGPGWGAYGGYPGYGYGRSLDFGRLRLQVQPRDAEVFVDGYYAGQVDDFDGRFQGLQLETGGYSVEIRKPGWEPLTFDVRVMPDRTTTYKGELIPRSSDSPEPPPPQRPSRQIRPRVGPDAPVGPDGAIGPDGPISPDGPDRRGPDRP